MKLENTENINNTYKRGNLRLLEMMIFQLNDLIDPSKPDHTPRPVVIDMAAINEKLCSTSKLVSLLSSGVGYDKLPDNEYIYTDDFYESINDYMDTKYIYEFYNDYAVAKIREDLQGIHYYYNKHGILPWQTKKLEDIVCGTSEVMKVSDFPTSTNSEESNEDKSCDMCEAEHDKDITTQTGFREYTGDLSHYSGLTEEVNMKENIIKGERTKEKESIDIIKYAPQFDIDCADITLNFPYILEIANVNSGKIEKHVIVITEILDNCIYCNQWDNINDNPHSGMVLTSSEFYERKGVLYKITGKDLK